MNDSLLPAIAEVTGVPAQTLFRDMPRGLIFDRPGQGFSSDLHKSAILCTARSGSSLLSVALEAYGFEFKEHLNVNGRLKSIVQDSGVKATSELAEARAPDLDKSDLRAAALREAGA